MMDLPFETRLRGALLCGADLRGANLTGVVGPWRNR
jgi:uncharacterized protein YjbI with pentapeptide repeats